MSSGSRCRVFAPIRLQDFGAYPLHAVGFLMRAQPYGLENECSFGDGQLPFATSRALYVRFATEQPCHIGDVIGGGTLAVA